MKQRVGLLLCLSTLLATGCGTKPATLPISPASLPNLTGNWQIQSGPASTTMPAAGVVLFGALRNTGAQVSGTFRFSNLAQVSFPNGCALNQVVTVTGVLDASGNLSLTSAVLADGSVITTQLVLPPVLTGFASGTISVSGKTCAFATAAAIGVEIAPITGTFIGPLTPVGALPPAGPAGTGTLTLTQSATPAADGQFAVTGTLGYALGTCTGTILVSGTVSGVGLMLTSITTSPELLPSVRLLGAVSPVAGAVNVPELLFAQFPCATGNAPLPYSYTGALTRQ